MTRAPFFSAQPSGVRTRRRRVASSAERELWQFAMREAVPLTPRTSLVPAVSAGAPPLAAPSTASPSTNSKPDSQTKPAPKRRNMASDLAGATSCATMAPPPVSFIAHTAFSGEADKARQMAGLDRRTGEKLKRGRFEVEARLDLHGMTQEAARQRLDGFIAMAHERQFRMVLVITGKGGKQPNPEEWDPWTPLGGILRRQTPRWLNEPPNRARVLAFSHAQPQHGGEGALYVLIRRKR